MGETSHKDKSKHIDGVHKRKKVHEKAAFAHRHAPDRSKTLVRRAVKKPGPSLKRTIHAYGAADRSLTPSREVELITELIKHKPLVPKVQVKKSPLISHFSSNAPMRGARIEARQYAPDELKFPEVHHTPPQAPRHKNRTTSDILERAMQQAVSHEQPPHPLPKTRRRKLAKTWVASALVVLVFAVGVSQNMTNIKLQMASAKAGFTPTLPKIMPSGYSMDDLEYSNGVVATRYHSNSSSNSYDIIQRTSGWDSQTLKVSFVEQNDSHFETVASGGLTVYIYGDHNATWVSNGIWYNIQSFGALSDHELVSMATST
jgi:hypothetical protein